MEHGRRRWRDFSKFSFAAQEVGDGGADAAGLVWIDLGELSDRFGHGLRIVVLQERASEPYDEVGPGAGDIESIRQRTIVAGRQDEVFPALAAIRPRQTDIDDPAEPVVIDRAKRLGWHLEHHGTLGQVEHAHGIDGVRIGRQEQRLGIHQLGEDKDFVILDPGAQKALVEGAYADPLKGVHERLERVREVQVVIDLGDGVLARHAVLEVERADARLDFVRRGDRRRDCGGRLGGGQAGQCQHGAGHDDCQSSELHSLASIACRPDCSAAVRRCSSEGTSLRTGSISDLGPGAGHVTSE